LKIFPSSFPFLLCLSLSASPFFLFQTVCFLTHILSSNKDPVVFVCATVKNNTGRQHHHEFMMVHRANGDASLSSPGDDGVSRRRRAGEGSGQAGWPLTLTLTPTPSAPRKRANRLA
jgi:hypothetical protein